MTTLNLGGMQSVSLLTGGIDYSQIIQQLSQANRAPGDALNQQIQTDQLKQNDWGNIATLASKLQNDLVALADNSTFSSFASTLSGTDSSSFSATTATNAVPGTYSVSVTKQLVNGAVTSGAQLGNAITQTSASTTSVTSAVFGQPISTGTVSVTLGTKTNSYTIKTGDTLSTVLNNLFSGMNVSWSITNNQLVVTNNDTTSSLSFGSAGDTSNFFSAVGLAGQVAGASGSTQGNTATGELLGHAQLNQTLDKGNFSTALAYSGAGTLSINGVNIAYNTSTDTLQTLINNINSSTAGVTASYDSLHDTMTLTSKTSQPVTVQDVANSSTATTNPGQTNNLAEVLGLSNTSATAPVITQGQPMQYTLNGSTTQLYSSSNTISNVIPGVQLTLNASPNTINSTKTSLDVTVSVAQDTSSFMTKVNTFVADFNSLYTQLQTYTQKGGDLQGDGSASQLAEQYMNDVLDVVKTSTTYPQTTLSEIGISNGPLGSAPGSTNTLQVDSNTLTTTFQNNPNEVKALLQGMASRLNQDLVNMTGQFNTLYPITSTNKNLQGVAQAQQNLYGQMITSLEQQQQQIYDQADQQAAQMQLQFTQLQQYQQQSAAQLNLIKALAGGMLG